MNGDILCFVFSDFQMFQCGLNAIISHQWYKLLLIITKVPGNFRNIDAW